LLEEGLRVSQTLRSGRGKKDKQKETHEAKREVRQEGEAKSNRPGSDFTTDMWLVRKGKTGQIQGGKTRKNLCLDFTKWSSIDGTKRHRAGASASAKS